MYAKSKGATTLGVDGLIIDVEVDVSAGLPVFDMVGMPAAMVREAKERVRTAIKNSGIMLQQDKVTVNLAPAGIRKDSAGLDLPIAVALLAAYNIVPAIDLEKYLFIGELSLEGECRGVGGVLPMVIVARENGIKRIVTARSNVNEALLVDDIMVYGVNTLSELIAFLNNENALSPAQRQEVRANSISSADDFSDVQGQFVAKRAFEIAAAGGHNLLMSGSPGAGKTMLARRMGSILPDMTREEALEVTKIYSIAGLLPDNGGLMTVRPFRSPHHTISTAAMIGGGAIPKPGEVSLSHNGVLFLDELPEFSRSALESLRQPLEDNEVVVARVNGTLKFPARIMLVSGRNPCPCSLAPSPECTCTPAQIARYNRKLSGPLLDRFDIRIQVTRVSYKELTARKKEETSAVIRGRVVAARERQLKRFGEMRIYSNSQMSHAMLSKYCHLTDEAEEILKMSFNSLKLSARSYDRIIKVSQTIADLDGSDEIKAEYVAEALQLRT